MEFGLSSNLKDPGTLVNALRAHCKKTGQKPAQVHVQLHFPGRTPASDVVNMTEALRKLGVKRYSIATSD